MRGIIVVLFGLILYSCGDPSKEAASEAAEQANSNITNTSDLTVGTLEEDSPQVAFDTLGTARGDMQDTLEEGEEQETPYMVEPLN